MRLDILIEQISRLGWEEQHRTNTYPFKNEIDVKRRVLFSIRELIGRGISNSIQAKLYKSQSKVGYVFYILLRPEFVEEIKLKIEEIDFSSIEEILSEEIEKRGIRIDSRLIHIDYKIVTKGMKNYYLEIVCNWPSLELPKLSKHATENVIAKFVFKILKEYGIENIRQNGIFPGYQDNKKADNIKTMVIKFVPPNVEEIKDDLSKYKNDIKQYVEEKMKIFEQQERIGIKGINVYVFDNGENNVECSISIIFYVD
ncbi:MAG: hypothetical protein KDH96_05090 [Candidatus Riesia sp.]|nr:hypothetical protein [Candidatus Riesia sp.]